MTPPHPIGLNPSSIDNSNAEKPPEIDIEVGSFKDPHRKPKGKGSWLQKAAVTTVTMVAIIPTACCSHHAYTKSHAHTNIE
ncbi:hypothetical protein CLAFUW4_07491 [Fulvia fulva]|uniref:Uncharacterized protein n=1 Tax=Passalora fulva TaxID=5499 RepID=A0A9Q8UR58_PASFU|nr:uncharacterized protein CLAFUR5_07621 [Fulvia fulva]KAK4621469.1 hypothetical protein CLAFUR4_07497 [Fulvia fulva]UJO19375.1 hypothetical protein CLAFUR5_07621 [Fulvia fulva]WPV16565.1 hypothetical protein CLAFUW4_07491 [Fulvia fulva]WPV30760.1 hypothetical protein CLAFUW7_07493 [Fulvia fulva]